MNRFAVRLAMIAALAGAVAGVSVLASSGALGAEARPPARSATHLLVPFHQVTLDGDADVTLVQGSAESVRIDVPGDSVVHAEVRDGVLTIHAVDERHWWSNLLGGGGRRRPPSVTIAFRDIDALRASGSVRLFADRLRADALTLRFSGAAEFELAALEARSLAIDGSGAFKATVGGRVDEQRVSISGAGDYRAGDLASERASISVSGAGRVLVDAHKTLDVELSGAGKVDYKGDPKVTQRVSGVGRVRRYDGALRVSPIGGDVNAWLPCPAARCRA